MKFTVNLRNPDSIIKDKFEEMIKELRSEKEQEEIRHRTKAEAWGVIEECDKLHYNLIEKADYDSNNNYRKYKGDYEKICKGAGIDP